LLDIFGAFAEVPFNTAAGNTDRKLSKFLAESIEEEDKIIRIDMETEPVNRGCKRALRGSFIPQQQVELLYGSPLQIIII
jgi:hypothetical protein